MRASERNTPPPNSVRASTWKTMKMRRTWWPRSKRPEAGAGGGAGVVGGHLPGGPGAGDGGRMRPGAALGDHHKGGSCGSG
jgi:hypothetical protein